MEGRHIPGFYWDASKKKYFKLLPGHLAPTGAQYTIENVKKEQEESKKRKRVEHTSAMRQKHLVQRSKPTHTPAISGLSISYETGLKRGDQITGIRSQAFVRSLERHTSFYLGNNDANKENPISKRPDFNVGCFDYDVETSGIIMGFNGSNVDSLVSVLPSSRTTWPTHFAPNPSGDTIPRIHYSAMQTRTILAFQSQISSVNISKSRTLITTATGSYTEPTIHITRLIAPHHANPSQPLDGGSSVLLKLPNVTTIFTSSPNPFTPSEADIIAIGSSYGIHTFTNDNGTYRPYSSNSFKNSDSVKTDSDVCGLDWLSATTLVAGLRDSTVMLYDVRSKGSVKRMRHSTGIAAVKRADQESRFVVAGFGGGMAMYDLRMLRDSAAFTGLPCHPTSPKEGKHEGLGFSFNHSPHSSTKQNKNQRKRRRDHHPQTSEPKVPKAVLKFACDNPGVYPFGFDVCEELGVVACAEKDGTVQIWSLRTGEKIRKLQIREEGSGHEKENVSCLRFVEDERGVWKIMAACGPRIIEFVW